MDGSELVAIVTGWKLNTGKSCYVSSLIILAKNCLSGEVAFEEVANVTSNLMSGCTEAVSW